jgi:hypothetical protein
MFALLIFLFFVSFWFQHTSLRGWIFIVNERKRKSGGRLCVFFSCLLFRSFLLKNNIYPSIYKFVAPGLKFPIMLSWPVAGLAHFLLSYQSYYMWWYIYGRNIAWDHDWGKDTHTQNMEGVIKSQLVQTFLACILYTTWPKRFSDFFEFSFFLGIYQTRGSGWILFSIIPKFLVYIWINRWIFGGDFFRLLCNRIINCFSVWDSFRISGKE